MSDRQILATSGGMIPTGRGPYQWRAGGLIRHAIELTAQRVPRLCFVNTAAGDSDVGLRACYGALSGTRADLSHVQLFPMPNVEDLRVHLLSQDVIWVGGGSVANLLALWRIHGLDEIMREAWEAGVVLSGVSAGSLCWHVGGTTDSFGPELRPVTNGLGFLPFGNGVHYDSEEQRRPALSKLVADGTLPLCYATDDGVGLHYVGTELVEAVAERSGASAWAVEADGSGGVIETRIAPRALEPS